MLLLEGLIIPIFFPPAAWNKQKTNSATFEGIARHGNEMYKRRNPSTDLSYIWIYWSSGSILTDW